jgi:4a-hydroxytetrahydrobiopterin dehydratase
MVTVREELLEMQCQPCRQGGSPLGADECQRLLDGLSGWELVGGKTLRKEYATKDFRDAMAFANGIAEVAERQDHHPDLHVSYRRMGVTLSTHAVGGLSVNDFAMAAKIDEVRSAMAAG